MMRCLLFLLLSMALCPRSDGADRPPPRVPQSPPPTIVLIPATPPAVGTPFAFDLQLQQALANHLGHLITTRNVAVAVKISGAPVAEDDALASLEQVIGHIALLVYYSGSLVDEPYIARDRHRRRYHARAENCLHLQLRYQRYERTVAGWTPVDAGMIEAQGEPSRLAVRTGSGIVYCEPHEYVLQRALNALAAYLPGVPGTAPASGASLPVKIYLSRALADYQAQHHPHLEHMVAFASRRFDSQFGVSLRLVAIDTLPARFARDRALREDQPALDTLFAASGDTIVVVLNRLLHADTYTTGAWQEEIGLSRLGQRRIYMDLLPSVHPDDTVWSAVANGLTLLHELGHAFGAIHVSDIASTMNHRANWVSAAAFDRLNQRLIAAALDGSLLFDDPAAYLRFFTRTLLATPYYLADYPAFLHDYLDWGDNRRISERLRNAVVHPSLLNAADAVGLLADGKPGLAAQLLRAAIRDNPQQASLYYYLSLAVDSRSAPALRAAARQRGYLMAIEP